MEKYRIEKHSEDRWWNPHYPPPGWWLIRGHKAKVCKSWGEALAAMWKDIGKRLKTKPHAKADATPEANA